jgi:hypothetical protein
MRTSFNLEQAPSRTWFDVNFFLGDYEGLAAAGNDFIAAWGMPNGSATAQESIFFRREFSTAGTVTAALLPASASLSAISLSAVAGTKSWAIVSPPLPASTFSSSQLLPSSPAATSPGAISTASDPDAIDKVQESHPTLLIRPNSALIAQKGFVTAIAGDLVADILAENMALVLVG